LIHFYKRLKDEQYYLSWTDDGFVLCCLSVSYVIMLV